MKIRYLAIIAALGFPGAAQSQTYNILLIAVDDLRPELGCYGNTVILSPNIDRFAASGITFNHAYCQQAISMASRASLFTGMFPERNGIYKCGSVTEACPEAVTLNGFFAKEGYTSDQACDALKELSETDKPFFLAVGFHKPHLPFNAPEKYWKMYERDKLKLPDNQYLPENFTEHTRYNFGELRNYNGIPKGTTALSEDLKKTLLHGYYACVSFTDAQIGKVLDKLKELGLEKNTIVVLFGDHGWKLGEHGMWCKHTNFELDTRSTLIMRVPGVPPARTDNFVEFLDIYPTLVELCGYKVPEGLDGTSMVPVIKKPKKVIRTAAFSIYPHNQNDDNRLVMGYSVGTPRYRYIEWVHVKSGKVEGKELYDHKTDPGENKNIAALPASSSVCSELSKMLRKKCNFKID